MNTILAVMDELPIEDIFSKFEDSPRQSRFAEPIEEILTRLEKIKAMHVIEVYRVQVEELGVNVSEELEVLKNQQYNNNAESWVDILHRYLKDETDGPQKVGELQDPNQCEKLEGILINKDDDLPLEHRLPLNRGSPKIEHQLTKSLECAMYTIPYLEAWYERQDNLLGSAADNFQNTLLENGWTLTLREQNELLERLMLCTAGCALIENNPNDAFGYIRAISRTKRARMTMIVAESRRFGKQLNPRSAITYVTDNSDFDILNWFYTFEFVETTY